MAAILVIFALSFAGEAAAKPDWFGTKIRAWSIQNVNGKLKLHLEITHSNNSKNRVVTAISDKSGQFTLKKAHVYRGKKATAFSVVKLSSNKVNKVKLSPGESTTLTYDLPITTCDNGLAGVSWSGDEARSLLVSGGWKLSWTYDCSVKSEKEY